MKNKNTLIISTCIVTILTILIVGATYAYWSWRTDVVNQTDVSFEVVGTGLSAHIEGNGTTEVMNLVPSACGNKKTIKKEVKITYQNETEHTATVSSTLSLIEFTLKNISIVPSIEQLQKLKYVLTISPDSCSTNIATDIYGNEISGNFSELEFEGGNAENLPLDLFTHSFIAERSMNQKNTKTYYLWVWLDESYEHQNVGNYNTDPMQGIKFTLKYSGTIMQNGN